MTSLEDNSTIPHDLIPLTGNHSITLPALFAPDPSTARRVLEFFTANIRNLHTRKAYDKAAGEFAAWCEAKAISHLRDVQPVHVAAYVEELQQRIAAPSVKVQLTGIRMLFDWLVVGHVMPMNPAAAVRGPKHSVKKAKTPVLTAEEARTLLDAINTSTIVGLRDRALICAHDLHLRARGRRDREDARRRRLTCRVAASGYRVTAERYRYRFEHGP
jgi:integrase